MISETSQPTTLLATVGLNPLPVALAILTLKPQQVLLVHSTESEAEALRIIEVIEEIEKDMRLGIRFAGAVTCGDGHDVTATVTEFARIARECFPDQSFLLDYTGGTKEMTIGAVSAHLEHHHDLDAMGGDYRSWVDDSTGTVTTGGSPGEAKPTDSQGLTLERIARLHGYDIEIHRPHLYAPEGTVYSALADEIADYVHNLDKQSNTTMRDDSTAAISSAAEIRSVAVKYATKLGIADDQDETLIDGRIRRNSVSDARGLLREFLVCADALAAIGDAGRLRTNNQLELLFGAKVTERGAVPGGPKLECDPDVLIRDGHKVLVIEVKSNAKTAVEKLGERLIAMRWAFGSAVAVAISSPEGEFSPKTQTHQPVTWDDLTAAANALKRDMFTLQKIHTWRSDQNGRDTHSGVLRWLAPPAGRAASAPKPRFIDVTGKRVIVVPVDGTPLAVEAALHYATSDRKTALGIGTAQNAALRRRIEMPQLQPLEQSSEASTISALAYAAKEISGVIVTPGPKGVTAGLLQLARKHSLDVAHITIAGRIQKLNSPIEEVSLFTPPWAERLAGYYTEAQGSCNELVIPRDDLGPAVTVEAVRDAIAELVGNPEIRTFIPTMTPTLVASQFRRARLIVTGTRGAVSVQYGTSTKRAKVRDVIKSVSTHLHALVGDAHIPLMVLRSDDPGDGAREMKHLIASNRWLPPLEVDPETASIVATDGASEALRLHLFGV